MSADCAAPSWPEICVAVVAFQPGQGVKMNLVGPFKGKGYFCLLPVDHAATEADVRRFALHSSKSLKARLEDVLEPVAGSGGESRQEPVASEPVASHADVLPITRSA